MFINKPSIVVFVVSGAVTEFPFEFKWFNESDIKVFRTPVGEAPDDETDILETSEYSIVGGASGIGGAIDISATLTDGDTITIARRLPVTRTTDYATRGKFTALGVNDDQDYQSYLLLDLASYSNLFLRLPVAGGGGDEPVKFPSPSYSEEYIRWSPDGKSLVNDTLPPSWRTETFEFRNEAEGFRDESLIFRNEAEGFRDESLVFRNESQAIYDAIVPAGDAQVARVIDEGDTQVARVIDEGDTQEARVTAEGDLQVSAVIDEGNIQEARVTAEGDAQYQRVIDAGDDGYVSSREAEAEAMTSDSFANEPEDIEVKKYYFNEPTNEILFNSIPNTYSALHWSLKSGQSALGLAFQGTWDASTGVYPTTRPDGNPLEVGDLFVVDVAGTIDSVDWFIRDWMIRNTTNDGWYRVPQVVEWNAIQGVPSNVVNAITDTELQASQAPQDTAIALNTAKLTGADRVLQTAYDTKQGEQDSAIALNTAKVGITTAQASAITANTAKVTGADRVINNNAFTAITNMTSLTQAQYDALGVKHTTTLYVIVG